MASCDTMDIPLHADESIDEFMHGRLRLIQSRSGYRFSIDAVLLSQFVTTREGDRVVDLGTGCGIIPLILLRTRPVLHVFGLEIQPGLAAQAERNASLNGLASRMSIAIADVRSIPLGERTADVVVCNPPYRQIATGRINPNPQRAIARHEILMSLDDILRASKRILRSGGRLALIYPAGRLVDMLAKMRGHGLEAKRIRFIHAEAGAESKLVLVEGCSDGRRGLRVLPPLIDPRSFSLS
jgi:tRNA1Val (adenine37-N6)-methyltransferase